MKHVLCPLSYGPHLFGGTTGTRTRIFVVLSDVVPSAFVTKLSKVAGDKIEESPAVVNRRTGFETCFGHVLPPAFAGKLTYLATDYTDEF